VVLNSTISRAEGSGQTVSEASLGRKKSRKGGPGAGYREASGAASESAKRARRHWHENPDCRRTETPIFPETPNPGRANNWGNPTSEETLAAETAEFQSFYARLRVKIRTKLAQRHDVFASLVPLRRLTLIIIPRGKRSDCFGGIAPAKTVEERGPSSEI